MAAMQAKLEEALAFHRRGEFSRARALYEEILVAQPAHVDALHLLGAVAAQTHDPRRALDLFSRALALDPAHAVAHYNRGKTLQDLAEWEAALASYERALALRPDYAEAWCNRGIVLGALGRTEAALASGDRALALDPGLIGAQFARAVALHALGRLDEALTSCEQCLARNPADAGVHAFRGLVLITRGEWNAALESLDRAVALKPDFAEAFSNRGLVLAELRRWTVAVESYDRAVALRPDFAEAFSNRALALAELRRFEAALESCERAIAIRPDYAKAHANRGRVLQELKRWPEALASYDCAIAIRADYAEAYLNRGVVLAELQRWQEALASYAKALAIDPRYAEAYYNCGNLLKDIGQWQAALSNYDRALAIDPRYAEAHSNRGTVLCELNRVPDALACYDAAIAIDPELPEAHFNCSVPRLMAGDYERGWRDYEWRWKLDDDWLDCDRASFAQPLWLGEEPLAGKTILLRSEQGFGDVIQFSRFASQVAELGARVILEVPHTLVSLLRSLRGVTQVLARGQPLPPFDCYCPLLSLPFVLQITLATVPARIPYLRCDAERLRYWRERLGARTRPRVGLVWSGVVRPDKPRLWSLNKRRNIPLDKLALLDLPEVEFYSLQKGQPAESQLAELIAQGWSGPDIRDFTRELRTFADTAALIEQLDLVISVDTSTAHLAGALGKPVWLMNRFDNCWRWMLDRPDTPWYPTMRLYRQARPGDWEGVVERIRTDLERWSAQAAPLEQNLERGVALHRAGELAQAQALYDEILKVQPCHFDGLHLSGVIAAQRREPERALVLIERALDVHPNDAVAHYNRGTTLQALGQWDSALAAFDRALELDDTRADAHLNRGIVQRERGQPEGALASYERALSLRPEFAQGYCNRGNALRDLDRLMEAVADYDRAIELQPEFAEAYCNRANVLRDLGKTAAALADYDRALALDPTFARAHVNRGLTWLSLGELERGWRDYAWRFRDTNGWLFHEQRDFRQPLWLGEEPIAGKTIVLHSEQGFGDTLQFCRYATLVAERGARVILEVPASLSELLATLRGVDHIVARGEPLPDFDCQCPLLSLPLAFKTTLADIPAAVPYLESSAARRRAWEARLGPQRTPRVGLVWAGARRERFDERSSVRGRDIPLSKLAPLKKAGLEFYSLQTGEAAQAELAEVRARGWDGPDLRDFTAELKDFAETAALMQQLDLIISVDTAAAHLAGALGKPVWLLNRYAGCWRWLLERSDSPWYPTMRIYRQARTGDWDSVVANVCADLERLAAS